jgi:NAD(P)-dependent dehydrogenase (short-subunit alcohol dehydrogenase family)
MQISNTIALVTGANRGLGLAFSRELVRRGAVRVYGAARHPDQVTEPGVTRRATGCPRDPAPAVS